MARNTATELRKFAERVEAQIVAANRTGSETMERLICRLLTAKNNVQVSATMAQKWVEWKYGKPTENLKIDQYVEHTIFDANRLTDEQLAEAERLVESAQSANTGSDPE